LYYPYRSFKDFQTKNVRSFFFVAEGGVFSLWEYSWRDPNDYESIHLEKAASYELQSERPPIERFESIEPDPNRDIVPQADDFRKIADFPLLVAGDVSTLTEWSGHYGIAYRQANYYKEAAAAMGLVSEGKGPVSLTREGRKYVGMRPTQRGDYLAEQILRIPIMNRVYREVKRAGAKGVGREEISNLIRKHSHLGGSTPMRRASTVLSFFRWMSQSTGALLVNHQRIYSLKTQARWVDLVEG
ncbi:MAG: AAA-associated domain-containing protein, partial [Thermoplasmata archaeon]|nr:AAA-associated domain-containing protein [Thermoplasmata archaeon]